MVNIVVAPGVTEDIVTVLVGEVIVPTTLIAQIFSSYAGLHGTDHWRFFEKNGMSPSCWRHQRASNSESNHHTLSSTDQRECQVV